MAAIDNGNINLISYMVKEIQNYQKETKFSII